MYLCFEISLLTIILVIIIFVLFFWGVYSVRKYKTKKNKLEHFDNNTMNCLIQADDSCQVLYRGSVVASTYQWNVATSFTINNPIPGEKIIIKATNIAGDGGLIFEFKIGDKIIYSNKQNCTFIGKESNSGRVAGNKWVGCFRDNGWNRDLSTYIGSGMTITNCMDIAISRGMPYYGMQNGGECWLGNSYGRYGYIGNENCSLSCNANYNERCGGYNANTVYSVNEQPNILEREKPGHADSRFTSYSKYLWPTEGGIFSVGTYIIHVEIPRFDTLAFCPDPDFDEYNPSGCLQPLDKNSCKSTPLANYTSELSKCYNKFDWNNYDQFYITMNRLFDYIQKNMGNPDHLKTLSKINTVSDMINKLKSKDRGNNYQSGARYMADFIEANYNLIVFLKMFADKIKYPIDKTQLTDDGFIESNTPMYYNLIRQAMKFDKPDAIKAIFKNIYKNIYLHARIIVNTPDLAKECECLGTSLAGNQKCAPCL